MDKFSFINEQLDILSVPYEFGEWTAEPIPSMYFTGESMDDPIMTEDGHESTTFILNGFNRGKKLDLELAKNKIKEHFDPIFGLRAKTDSGSIAVFFDNSFYIPTGEADLNRIQINLKIHEWKGAK